MTFNTFNIVILKKNIKAGMLPIVLCLLIGGCSEKAPMKALHTIQVDFKNEISRAQSLTTRYFKERKLVALETTAESLIGQISRVIIFDGKYYVFDHSTKSVFIFSGSGKYISKICRVGKGPGEYVQLTDFTLDIANKQLILVCDIPSKTMYFDLKGAFVREEMNEHYIQNISASDNTLLLSNLSNGEEYYLRVKGKNGKYSEFLPIEDYTTREKEFYPFGPSIIRSLDTYYFKAYDNTVYKLLDEKIVPAYRFEFGNHMVDKGTIENNSMEKISNISHEKNLIARISDFRECSNYLIFATYPYSKRIIYDKRNQEFNLFDGFYDPETGLRPRNYFAHDGTGDDMMFIMNAEIFVHDITHFRDAEKAASDSTYLKYRETADRLKADSNPVLLFYTLK